MFYRKSSRRSRSQRAGLIFPVPRFANKLRSEYRVKRLTQIAPVYLTAVIEYLVAEVVELSGNACRDMRRKRITPRDVNLAIMNDEELYKLLKNIVIPQGGVIPELLKNTKSLPKINKTKLAVANLAAMATAPTPKKIAQKKTAKKTQNSGITTLTQRTLASGQIVNLSMCVLQADITDIETEAIVSHYNLGGMVGSAISNRGGLEMQTIMNNNRAEINNLPECGAGVTDASQSLLCKKIIHVNSPSWSSSSQTLKINQLTKAVENIIEIANKNRFKTLAIPNLCSAGNGYPKQVAAQTILRAINNHFKNTEKQLGGANKSKEKSSIEKISFILYDTESVNVYTSELAKLEI